MTKRNRLFSVLLVALITTSAVYGQDWLSRLNLSSGEYTRKISLLNFDSTNSNLSSYHASRAMNGFFSGLDPQGSYRINLSRKWVGDTDGSIALMIATSVTFLALLGAPCIIEEYRLTMSIEIRDLSGNLIQTVTKSEDYTIGKSLYTLSSITQIEMDKISKVVSNLIRQARNELNYEATTINNRLELAAHPFNKNFDELTAKLKSGTSVALLPVSGSDAAENSRILAEMTSYFLDSEKKYVPLNREHIDKVVAEVVFQGSVLVDKETAVRVGKIIGARVIIVSRVDSTSNGKQLVMHAIDVETGRPIGTSVAVY